MTAHRGAGVFIPKGRIQITDAVRRVVKVREPALVEAVDQHAEELKVLSRISFLPPPIRPLNHHSPYRSEPIPTPGEAEAKRVWERNVRSRRTTLYEEHNGYGTAWEKALIELRQGLGDGHIAAILLTLTGHEVPIPIEPWRTKDGLQAIYSGVLALHLPYYPFTLSGTVILDENDFVLWLMPSKPTVAIAKERQCEAWLIGMMRAAPETPRRRTDVAEEAEQKFNIKGRAFLSVWAVAVRTAPAPAWSKAGRKRKLNR
jgi:hypothetical protein